MTLTDSNDSKF